MGQWDPWRVYVVARGSRAGLARGVAPKFRKMHPRRPAGPPKYLPPPPQFRKMQPRRPAGRTLPTQSVWNADDGYKLTDPAMHCAPRGGRRRGATDKGNLGITNFFRTHKCSLLCRQLGLKAFESSTNTTAASARFVA